MMFDKKMPHEFRQLPGDHSWAYWDQQIPHVLEIAAQKLRLPAAVRAGARAAGA
jgi:S-formylglutathione hydrolase FrmB